MNNILLAFLLTFISGFSTVIGTIPIFFKIKNKEKLINSTLAFSSGVMISISLFSLIKESYNLLVRDYNKTILLIFLYIILGFFITNSINLLLSSINNKLYKIGLINMIALIIHNLPEGIITFLATSSNSYLGLTIAFSIMCHNIPEGLSISIPIFYSTNNKIKAFIYTFISGFSEFFGALITFLFFYRYINDFILGIILAITTGIMIYISLIELLPQALLYNKKRTILFFLIGFIFMIFFK
jgi:ZIP family zinc transporter